MKKKKAFTLIEVMVVMAIIAVLATLIIGAIVVVQRAREETIHRSNAKNLQAGFERYFSMYRVYCGSTEAPVYISCDPYSYTQHSITWWAGLLAQVDIAVDVKATKCDTGTAAFELFAPSVYAKNVGGGGANRIYGGGDVNVSSQGYSIKPVDHSCANYMDDDIIQVP